VKARVAVERFVGQVDGLPAEIHQREPAGQMLDGGLHRLGGTEEISSPPGARGRFPGHQVAAGNWEEEPEEERLGLIRLRGRGLRLFSRIFAADESETGH
jgi:hypothetical protein